MWIKEHRNQAAAGSALDRGSSVRSSSPNPIVRWDRVLLPAGKLTSRGRASNGVGKSVATACGTSPFGICVCVCTLHHH